MSIIKEATQIEVDKLHPRMWNPNRMSDMQFNLFSSKVDEEGFTDPIKVCPATVDEIKENNWEDDKVNKHYWIWAGEHRWRYARIKNMKTVPCVIYEGKEWNEAAQKLKMVRDNMVHGDMDARKFTDLVKSLDESLDINPNDFGFQDQLEMDKYLIREKEEREKSFLDGFMESTNKSQEAVESLSDIVSNIFSQCAETIDQSYLHFTYKGNVHCVVLCNKDTKSKVDEMTKYLKDKNKNINDFISGAITKQLHS